METEEEQQNMITRKQLRAERDKAMEIGARYKAEAEARARKIEDQALRIRILEEDLERQRKAAEAERAELTVKREEYRQLVLSCVAVVRTSDARVRETRQMLERLVDTADVMVDSLREVSHILGDQSCSAEVMEVVDA